MEIKFKEKTLVLWPKNKSEEKKAEKIRDFFDDIDYSTDRIWNEQQEKQNKPLGVRIYF